MSFDAAADTAGGSGRPRVDLRAVGLRAGRGDRDALTMLVRATAGPVWQACAALVDVASAEDLAQETFLRAVRSLPGYRGDAEPTYWFLAIARRVCAEEISRRQRVRQALARLRARRPGTVTEPFGAIDLADALSRLSDPQREALLLTTVGGLSYEDAAAVCGCPVGTIRSRVSRARAALHRALFHPDDGTTERPGRGSEQSG